MKANRLAALVAALLVTATAAVPICTFTGCASIPGTTLSRILNKAKGLSFMISAKLLTDHPEYRDGFMQASADLKYLADTEVIDVSVVLAVIQRLPKLQDGDARIFVEGAVIMFEDELSALAVKNPDHVRQAARGLYQGIDAALGFTVPKALTAPRK